MKNIRFFLSVNFQFLEVNFSIYLNRPVFVMTSADLNISYSYARKSNIFIIFQSSSDNGYDNGFFVTDLSQKRTKRILMTGNK